jgi:hypothetical protein
VTALKVDGVSTTFLLTDNPICTSVNGAIFLPAPPLNYVLLRSDWVTSFGEITPSPIFSQYARLPIPGAPEIARNGRQLPR